MIKLLCMSDVYVQPGSQSVTMQLAVCCRCAVILDDVRSHRFTFNSNGVLVKNDRDLISALSGLSDYGALNASKINSYNYARKYYDYALQAKRICKV